MYLHLCIYSLIVFQCDFSIVDLDYRISGQDTIYFTVNETQYFDSIGLILSKIFDDVNFYLLNLSVIKI